MIKSGSYIDIFLFQNMRNNKLKHSGGGIMLCFQHFCFYLSVFVRFLFVFDLLFNLFRIALWPSVGKNCPLAFSVVLFLF